MSSWLSVFGGNTAGPDNKASDAPTKANANDNAAFGAASEAKTKSGQVCNGFVDSNDKLEAGLKLLLAKHKKVTELRQKLKEIMVRDLAMFVAEATTKEIAAHANLKETDASVTVTDANALSVINEKYAATAGEKAGKSGTEIQTDTMTPPKTEKRTVSDTKDVSRVETEKAKKYTVGDYVKYNGVRMGRIIVCCDLTTRTVYHLRLEGTGEMCSYVEYDELEMVSSERSKMEYSPSIHRFCSKEANELDFTIRKLRLELAQHKHFARMILCALGMQLKPSDSIWTITWKKNSKTTLVKEFKIEQISAFHGLVQGMKLKDSANTIKDIEIIWCADGDSSIIYIPSCKQVLEGLSCTDREIIEMFVEVLHTHTTVLMK
jgi:hypothetical protein